MKVIDLLNMISKGEEVPEKIKWNTEEWEYIEEMKDYYSFDRHTHLLNTVFPNDGIAEFLNDEIEIIEEKPTKIEELELVEIQNLWDRDIEIEKKINELTKAVNYLLEKESDK